MARIALEHVDKIYPNGYTAAKDLSLEIHTGSCWFWLDRQAAESRQCFG